MRTKKISSKIVDLLNQISLYSNVKRAKMSAALFFNKGIKFPQHNVRIDGHKNWTIHAEERLLTKFNCSGSKIIVFRSNGDKSSKPCRKCIELLKMADVKKVIFFDLNGSWIEASPFEL